MSNPLNTVQSLVPCVYTKGRPTTRRQGMVPSWRILTKHSLYKSAARFQFITKELQAPLPGKSPRSSDHTCCLFPKLNTQLYVPFVFSYLRLVLHSAQTEFSSQLSLVSVKCVIPGMWSRLKSCTKVQNRWAYFLFSIQRIIQHPSNIILLLIPLFRRIRSLSSLDCMYMQSKRAEIFNNFSAKDETPSEGQWVSEKWVSTTVIFSFGAIFQMIRATTESCSGVHGILFLKKPRI